MSSKMLQVIGIKDTPYFAAKIAKPKSAFALRALYKNLLHNKSRFEITEGWE
jgi:hypothetical protein